MKLLAGVLIAALFVQSGAYGQEKDYVQNPTLGIYFTLTDFRSAANIRNTSLSQALARKEFGQFEYMTPGLAVNYVQGISEAFDFSTTLAGTYVEYPRQDQNGALDEALLLELDASIRGKMFSNKYWFNPYVQAGVGVSKSEGYFGAFLPLGVGFQVNLFSEAYIVVNSQYRVPVTQSANYHFFHSIGLAGNLGRK
jgi:OmpA-OmpF porin, OOP family